MLQPGPPIPTFARPCRCSVRWGFPHQTPCPPNLGKFLWWSSCWIRHTIWYKSLNFLLVLLFGVSLATADKGFEILLLTFLLAFLLALLLVFLFAFLLGHESLLS